MTEEQLKDVEAVVEKAHNLIKDIAVTKEYLEKVTALRETTDGVEYIKSKDFNFIFDKILGQYDTYRESLTTDKEKLLDSCIEILTDRVTRLETEFAELPTYHTKAQCLTEMINSNSVYD